MISEVLPYVLMITCILIRVSSKEVKWTVRVTSPELGKDLTLFCKVDNCFANETKRWHGGPDYKLLMVNSGISTDKTKYNTSIENNGFILTILNLTVKDLNVSYECSCGLDNDKHILYVENVYKVDNLNKSTNGTNSVAANDGSEKSLYVIMALAIFLVIFSLLLVVLTVVINKKIECSWIAKPDSYKDIVEYRGSIAPSFDEPEDEDSQNPDDKKRDLVLPPVATNDFLRVERVSLDHSYYSDENSIRFVRSSSLQSVRTDDSNASSKATFYSAEESLEPSTSREASNAIVPTIVPLAKAGIVYSDEDDNKNVTDSLIIPVEVDSTKNLGSSTPSVHIGYHRRQGSGSSTPSFRTGNYHRRPGSGSSTLCIPMVNYCRIQDSGSSLKTLHEEDFNQSQCSDTFMESMNSSDLSVAHNDQGVPRAKSSLESTTCDETSLAASTHAVKKRARYEYRNIKLREKSFKTWPLNVPTIEQLAEAGFFHSGHTNIAQCFSCGNSIHWKEGQDPLDKKLHINCKHLCEITSNTQLKTACSPDQ